MFRDFVTRLLIIWKLLCNSYTNDSKHKRWILWTDKPITIFFEDHERIEKCLPM